MRIFLALRSLHFRGRATLLRIAVFGVLLASGPMCAFGQTSPSASTPAVNPDRLPITTSSPEAAKLFEEGLRLSYDLHTEQALTKWREATRKDPNFAQAWAYIVFASSDPVEAKRAAVKARLASQNATPGEKLLVKWLISTNEGHFVDAIAAMNDLLAMYPRDAELNYEAESWLDSQHEYEAAAKFGKRALAVDPNFAGALNILGYDLAGMHQYEQAIPYLKRYVELEPNDANPRDSLAEILQKAGRLEESLAEYREALKLDPKYYFSQLGVGDIYALMGKQDRAREEYAKAIPMALTPQFKLDCQIQSAIAYAREGNAKQARVELAAVLAEAAKLQLNDYRSIVHQDLALLAESPAAAFQHLDKAEAVLQGPGHVSGANRSELLADTLRLRARMAAEAGKLGMARTAVARLRKMIHTNPSNNAIKRAYHGANGALLAVEKKTRAAIEELEEDPENAFSLAKLAELQAASGNAQDAAETRARLQTDYDTTLEDWLVVRKFRQSP
jgi:tetratricopeptide (TPR) repeat protein